MAFSFTITSNQTVAVGNRRIVTGTWNAASVTAGSIETGLNQIYFSSMTNKVSETDLPKIDDTTTNGVIKFTGVTSNDTGTWFAVGN